MTLVRVPKDNVTLEKVQEVLKDFTSIPDITHSRNVDASLVFKSPNIEASFIDPDWCAGDTEETRKIELSVDNPISCYDYINYGGEKTMETEIYFSNLMSWDVGSVDMIEGAEKDFTSKYPAIPFYPNSSVLSGFYTNQDSLYPGDPNGRYAKSFYRETAAEFLQKYAQEKLDKRKTEIMLEIESYNKRIEDYKEQLKVEVNSDGN